MASGFNTLNATSLEYCSNEIMSHNATPRTSLQHLAFSLSPNRLGNSGDLRGDPSQRPNIDYKSLDL